MIIYYKKSLNKRKQSTVFRCALLHYKPRLLRALCMEMTMKNGPLKSLLGKRFLSASTAVYPSQDASDRGPLEINFDDNSCVVFEFNMDGQSIDYSFHPLIFADVSDNNTVWNRIPIVLPQFVGSRLTKVEAYEEDGYVPAFRVWFNSNFICFANCGDTSEVTINRNPESFSENWVLIN